MLGVVRGELIKLRHRPATWIIVVLSAFFLILNYYAIAGIDYYLVVHGNVQPDGPINLMRAALLPNQSIEAAMAAVAFESTFLAFILGALLAGSEYGWGTYKTILTVRPTRPAVYAGQIVGVAIGAAAMISALFISGVIASLVGARLLGENGDWPAVLTFGHAWIVGWLILATWGVLGYLIGTLMRSAPMAIGIGFVWFLVVESLLQLFSLRFHAVEALEQWLPWANTITLSSIFGTYGATGNVLQPVHDGHHYVWVPEVYLVAAVLLGILVFRRRDVT